jgi:hypothetical protein
MDPRCSGAASVSTGKCAAITLRFRHMNMSAPLEEQMVARRSWPVKAPDSLRFSACQSKIWRRPPADVRGIVLRVSEEQAIACRNTLGDGEENGPPRSARDD